MAVMVGSVTVRAQPAQVLGDVQPRTAAEATAEQMMRVQALDVALAPIALPGATERFQQPFIDYPH